jgi:two-component system, cell cycle sensor histidine kinase and response regulator CckA
MRISTLLKISVAVAMLMVVGLAVTNWFTATRLTLLSSEQDQAQTAARDISNLLVLTHEYAIYSGERAAQQWSTRHATIIKNLEAEAKNAVPAPPEAIKDAAVLSELFQQLVGSTSNRPAIQSYQKQLLLDQMQARSQALAESIHRWSNAITEERHKSEQTFFFLTISIPIMMSLILALLAYIVRKRVLSPLKRLLQAVRAVMNGDLSVRSATGTDDELGEVSHAFDAMAIDMVAGLKQQIDERKRAEDALLNEKAFLRSLIDSASDLIYFKDVNGAYLGCNKACEKFTGLSEQEQRGKTDFDFFDTEMAERIIAQDQIVLKSGDAVRIEEWVVSQNGVKLLLDTVKAAIHDKDGQPIGLVGISRDITNQKKDEQVALARVHLIEYAATHTLDELLTETLDNIEDLTGSQIGFFHLMQEDQRTLTLHAWSTRTSRDFCKAEGTGSHYDIGKAGVWVDCVHQRQPVVHNDYASLPHRKGMPPGHAAVVRELGVPIFRSGSIVAILGIGNKGFDYTDEDVQIASRFADLVWDIAERKQIAESLRESDERFTVAFNNAPIIITFSTIDDGAYLDVNQQFLDVSGFSRDEVIGKTSVELDFISQSDWMLLIEKIKQHGKIHDHELMLRSKSGQKRFCKYWGEIVSVAGVNCLLSIALDITDHRRVEQQLQQSQKMESIGNLAGGVAHDFNNMLCVILGHAELALLGIDSTKPLYNHLAVIRSTAERSADLTRQLLAFASKQTIAPKVLNLNEAVTNMLRMLHRLIGENIDLAWQPATDLWQIKFDLSQIDQIMANLCVNARDAITGTGRIIIETRNSSIDKQFCANRTDVLPGEYVQLIVSDNGIGMDEATLDRIFEPFFTTKEVGKGTGLGLATVFGIVRQHKGFISVNSKPGAGTTFTIYLPRYADETGNAVKKDVAIPPPCGREVILLVEDELEILNVTAMILARQGYTVHQADTPAKAISLAGDHAGEISLLVTDVIMPGMSGKELAGILKSQSPQLRCLFMSGYTADIIGHHGVLSEGVHFIQKPFTFPELSVKVREVLDS